VKRILLQYFKLVLKIIKIQNILKLNQEEKEEESNQCIDLQLGEVYSFMEYYFFTIFTKT